MYNRLRVAVVGVHSATNAHFHARNLHAIFAISANLCAGVLSVFALRRKQTLNRRMTLVFNYKIYNSHMQGSIGNCGMS